MNKGVEAMDIRLLVMDVDGTLTDGKIYMGEHGELFKAFNIKDGYGIHDILIPAGIKPIIITGRKSLIVEKRCQEVGITEIYQGVHDKTAKLVEILEQSGCDLQNIAYIGDDLNDFPCMQLVKKAGGCVGCPADAVVQVRDYSDFISEYSGGEGAVRDFIEFVCERRKSI